jgi:hypothetical protein
MYPLGDSKEVFKRDGRDRLVVEHDHEPGRPRRLRQFHVGRELGFGQWRRLVCHRPNHVSQHFSQNWAIAPFSRQSINGTSSSLILPTQYEQKIDRGASGEPHTTRDH